jgi:hypothetical protein
VSEINTEEQSALDGHCYSPRAGEFPVYCGTAEGATVARVE